MVGIFASLKWRLVTSRIRSARGGAKVGLILGWCAGALVLAALAFTLVVLRLHPDAARAVVTTLFTAQLVAWSLTPLIAFGVDETVDPAKFALLPLTTRTLQRGLLVTALIGYLPVANAIVLVGAAIALSTSWSLLPLALVVCSVQLVTCVVASRTLSTAMSNLMSGRRGRDLGVMVGFAVFVLYVALNYTLNSRNGANRLGRGASSVAGGLGWTPPGALAQLPGFVSDGRWVRVVVAALIALLFLGVLWFWWGRVLARSLTTGPSETENAAPRRAGGGVAVGGTVFGTMKLVAARDRLLAWRDPVRRVGVLMIAFLALAYPFLIVRGHGSVYAVAFPALLGATLAGNCYGVDGSALWLHMVAFADRPRARGELWGHSLVAVVPTAGIVLIAACLQAAVRDDWRLLPGALGICVAVLLGGVAMAGYISARLPFAARQSRKSMFANSISGQKGRTTGASLAMFGVGILVGLPSAGLAVAGQLVAPIYGWCGLLVGIVLGLGALAALSGVAARTYLDRSPEILAVVAIGDRS